MNKLKQRLYEVIFEADTPAGKTFDVLLMLVILISVVLVMLESVPSIRQEHYTFLHTFEWIITGIFTLEYIVRIMIVQKPRRYIFSFLGIVDVLAVLPSFFGLFLIGVHQLAIIRIIRLLRVFRILKLTRYTGAGRSLMLALWASRAKIGVFIFFVLILVVIIGTLMYLVEGEANGFTSIPKSIYWAIVTLTTVGYGDISPQTPFGQLLASAAMILGYAIIAVPTGIVTAEIIKPSYRTNTQVCPNCMYSQHDDDAEFCKKCGTKIK
ncbi:MAG: ion transporter [Prolixibacteraceae bacterium]|nr:ion transporter [Prolixibacteraceae bacterium]MBN2649866.1 ion transporter [Prolixibacteraceae bacterium]